MQSPNSGTVAQAAAPAVAGSPVGRRQPASSPRQTLRTHRRLLSDPISITVAALREQATPPHSSSSPSPNHLLHRRIQSTPCSSHAAGLDIEAEGVFMDCREGADLQAPTGDLSKFTSAKATTPRKISLPNSQETSLPNGSGESGGSIGHPSGLLQIEIPDTEGSTAKAVISTPTELVGRHERQLREHLERQYDAALTNREISYLARRHSLRSSALVTLLLFVGYVVVGCLFYSRGGGKFLDGSEARWPYRESLLFTIYTITTVGYGNHDIPDTARSQAFTTVFLLVGIAMITVVVSEVFQYLTLEATRAQYSRDTADIARKGLRALEKSGGHSVSSGSEGDAHAVRAYLNDPCWKRSMDCFFRFHRKMMDYFNYNRLGQLLSVMLPMIFLIGVGATVVGSLEGWGTISSIYWAVVTLSTVGYGDLHPTKSSSVWFCIFYLPFSIYFMSLFFSNVASTYMKMHALNIARIEEKLRKENDALTETQEAETSLQRQSTMKDLLATVREQSSSGSISDDESGAMAVSSELELKPVSAVMACNTLDTAEDEDNLMTSSTERDVSSSSDRRVRFLASSKSSTRMSSRLLSKPSFSVRTRVQERLARIIVTEVACNRSEVNVTGDDLTITFSSLAATEKRWAIPRKARDAFRLVAFEVLLHVGERKLVARGAEELFDLPSMEFHKLFNPLLAAMGSADTMEAWLISTNLLTNAELIEDPCDGSTQP